jgi:hypothetical protein
MTQPTLADIRHALQSRMRELVAQLAPGGYAEGGKYFALNPTRNDRNIGSFVIWLEGDGAGAWKDYATSDKGDVFDLIRYCLQLPDKQQFAWAKRWLGFENGALPQGRQLPKAAPVDDAAEREANEKKTMRARAMWFGAQSSLLETKAETYLSGRGIDLRMLKKQPGALRFIPDLDYWIGKTESLGKFPAIVAAMVREGDGIVAVHRTYLKQDGSDKADIKDRSGKPAPRKVYGPRTMPGSAIYISRGESNLPVKEANENGIADTLVLCEGIEDGLSIALSMPEARVWAAYSLSNLAALKLPPCAHDVIVYADNDWGKKEAEAAFKRAIDALGKQCPRLRIARSTHGKDANDLLRKGAA